MRTGVRDVRRVTLLGPWPPPTGGVATHLVRLEQLLRDHDVGVSVLGHGGFPETTTIRRLRLGSARAFFWELVTTVPRGAILHGHSTLIAYPLPRLLQAFRYARTVRRLAWIETLHDETLIKRFPMWPAELRQDVAATLGAADHVIAVSSSLQAFAQDLGLRPSRVSQIGPLLPTREGTVRLPEELLGFVEGHRPLIVATGAETPVYDFVTIIDAFVQLRAFHPNAGLVLLSSTFSADPEYQREVTSRTTRWPDDVRIVRDARADEVQGVLATASVAVRGARVDSFGLSRAEALLAHVPLVGTVVPSSSVDWSAFLLPYEHGQTGQLAAAVEAALRGDGDEPARRGAAYFEDLAGRDAARLLNLFREVGRW